MSIFRKKEEEEEKEEEKFPSRKRKKDLESKSNSRRKKKTSEPWTKKERFLVFYVLLTTIVISIILAFSARSWKVPGLPRISLPSFSGTFVIEKDKAELDENAKAAINDFKEDTRKLSGVYGFYVFRLNNNLSYGVNEQEIFEPASLNKLPVMLAMYLEAEKGSLDLETVYTLKDSDKVAGSGSLSGRPEGYELTYRELLSYMGQESDNTAANIAKSLLGEEKIRESVEKMGMTDTKVLGEDQQTTPQDIGTFFEKLWNDDLISKKNRNEFLEFLTKTIYEEWLAAGIPTDVEVAHKYGREIHIVNDAGIVFADEPFVLVLLSKGVVEREADQAFPDLAKIIYQYEAE